MFNQSEARKIYKLYKPIGMKKASNGDLNIIRSPRIPEKDKKNIWILALEINPRDEYRLDLQKAIDLYYLQQGISR